MRILSGDIEDAQFVDRPNRFVVRCEIDGKTTDAYLPNPGRLWELLFPGTVLYLRRNGPNVKLPYTVLALEKDGIPILLHTHLANDVAERLLKRRLVPGLEDFRILRREFTVGRSRFDFLLEKDGREMVLEVKNCTLFGGSHLAMFPDAVTERGSRHLRELVHLASSGTAAGVLFLVQWPRAQYFMPDYHTDPVFAQTLLSCRDRIFCEALSLGWNRDLSLKREIGRLAIPWDTIERKCRDEGCYIVILRLEKDRTIETGGLGKVRYRKGYYLYAGSAQKGLTRRMERHGRRRKNLFWHIDYLREQSSFHKALAVRACGDIECELASGLRGISEWTVPGFGCSDCTCDSHLFAMAEDPLRSPRFIDLLCHHRMTAVEKELDDGIH